MTADRAEQPEWADETRVHPHLVVQDLGHARVLRIDREEKLGALSSGLIEALGAQVTRVRQDRSIRALILTGTGRGFIAGADIGEYVDASVDEFTEYQRRARAVFDELERLPQPTIAAVNGYAFGGGFEVALCCDFILASADARFALPEVKLGLVPGGGGTQRLARAIGARRTKELIMTGRTVRADEALRLGILTDVVQGGALLDAALALAETLAARAPLAVREIKRLVDDGLTQELTTGLTTEQRALVRMFSSSDGQEGIRAFIDKREPEFHDE